MHTSPVVVTVAGHGEATCAPERCTVTVVVRIETGDVERSVGTATATVSRLTELINAKFDSNHGPINWWSLDQVRHSRHRPYNKDGLQLPYVYRAEAALEVKFSQLGAVGGFVDSVSTLEGVNVGNFDWALTSKSRAARIVQVRELAIRDAQSKAETYARSLGRNTVHPVAIADPGMLGVDAGTSYGGVGARAFAAGGSNEAIALKPENITLSADVHARFEAW
ncbi:SIMPL domain-containing protein [Rhodococcus sp. USK13]|uniref:SIMPL domain-containing protein n=1 Tax=Rhodococcus sp. USK13 TaxID=2806442 RepID=UPI001BCACCCB|nr:SIMPL domain-containing protein [Rhodococcus sp. USK13]